MKCMYDFGRRQELPLNMLPAIIGGTKGVQTDVNTMTNYCNAIEKAITCFGKTFKKNCIDKNTIELLKFEYDMNITYVFVGEITLCPNKNNGMTYEDLSCLATVIKHMDINNYQCQITRDTFSIDKYQTLLMHCHLVAVYKKCGEAASTALCKLYQSNTTSYNWGWPVYTKSCDSYKNEPCACFKAVDIW